MLLVCELVLLRWETVVLRRTGPADPWDGLAWAGRTVCPGAIADRPRKAEEGPCAALAASAR